MDQLTMIDWENESGPQVIFRTCGVSGEVAFEYRLALDSLVFAN